VNNLISSLRNKLLSFGYRLLLKPLFFKFYPETIHDSMVSLGSFLGKYPLTRNLTKYLFFYRNRRLEQRILGIKFVNPIGLAAGFDKNAQLTDILPSVGFGFAEVGSITGEHCEGNPKPRLWRLKNSKGLVVHYGLKNDGCEVISKKLRGRKFAIPIGTNIAKTNCKETVDVKRGIVDYVKAFREFRDIGDYFTINISCPNAFGGQPFTNPSRLERLLKEIDKIRTKKPIFLKLSPDLSSKHVDDILGVVRKHRIHGFICSNLTKKRRNKRIIDEDVPANGGISGKVVKELSNKLIPYIFKKTGGKYVIIGLGGVFNALDAYKKIKLGASLVQLITGMIFEGPQVISDINLGLVKLLEKDGYSNISQAIGVDIKLHH